LSVPTLSGKSVARLVIERRVRRLAAVAIDVMRDEDE
jgi:hypothetical protein